MGETPTFDRPSRHGARLGDALADLAEAGTDQSFSAFMCATCAFRRGSMPNCSAGTALVALKSVMNEDANGTFACHHGLREGEPTRICAGFAAAQTAPFETFRAIIERLGANLAADELAGPDLVQAAFDAWFASRGEKGNVDVYALAREYAALPRPIHEPRP